MTLYPELALRIGPQWRRTARTIPNGTYFGFFA